jgi:hypothetical protein
MQDCASVFLMRFESLIATALTHRQINRCLDQSDGWPMKPSGLLLIKMPGAGSRLGCIKRPDISKCIAILKPLITSDN